MANPTLLTQPFAANGDKNVIPNTTAVQGAFSQDKGFPAECSLPLGAGGVAPSRQDFNGAFNMLSSLMYYTQKGYTWHWDAGQEYFVDCVVVDDTDGKMYRCINNVTAGGSVPSADSTNWETFSLGGGGKTIGEIVWRSVTDPEVEGELLADGAEISRTMYPDLNALYAAAGYPWGDGDGSTTFNLPNLIGRFPEGASVAGGYHEAGLPNIIGTQGWGNKPADAVEGAFFTDTGLYNDRINYEQFTDAYRISFDASRSNSIYGNSDTVQPPSALLLPYVVVFTDATADSALVDMTQYDQDLANKANRSLSNIDSNIDVVVDSYRDNDGNWYRKYKSGWLEQGGRWVAQTTAGGYATVSLITPMQSSNYAVTSNIDYGSEAYTDSHDNDWVINRKTTTTFMIARPRGSLQISWVACGQGANV